MNYWRAFVHQKDLETAVRAVVNPAPYDAPFGSELISDLLAERHYYCQRHGIRLTRFKKTREDRPYRFYADFPSVGWHPVSWTKCVKQPPTRETIIRDALRQSTEAQKIAYRRAHPVCENCGRAPSVETHHAQPTFSEIVAEVFAVATEAERESALSHWNFFDPQPFALPSDHLVNSIHAIARRAWPPSASRVTMPRSGALPREPTKERTSMSDALFEIYGRANSSPWFPGLKRLHCPCPDRELKVLDGEHPCESALYFLCANRGIYYIDISGTKQDGGLFRRIRQHWRKPRMFFHFVYAFGLPAAELAAWEEAGQLTHRADHLFNRIKESAVKGLEQGLATHQRLRITKECFVLVVTYEQLFVGTNALFSAMFKSRIVPRMEEKFGKTMPVPLENIFLLTVDEFERTVARVAQKKILSAGFSVSFARKTKRITRRK